MDENAVVRSGSAPGPPEDVPSKAPDIDSASPSTPDEAHGNRNLAHESDDTAVATDPSSSAQGTSTSTQCAPVPEGTPDDPPYYSHIQVQPCESHGVLLAFLERSITEFLRLSAVVRILSFRLGRLCLVGGPNYYEITCVDRKGASLVARRRFDDLVKLHEDLKKRFRGCVIPFRPGKTLANSSMLRTHSDNFLRARAYAIKCYLNKVVQHPELKESTVRMFR